MEKTLFTRAQEALDRYLNSVKSSRAEHTLNNTFNYEMKDHFMGGQKIRRFKPQKELSAFAVLGGRAAAFAAIIGQQMDHVAEVSIEAIKTGVAYVQRTYATPAYVAAPETNITLSQEFASAELISAIQFQIENALDDVERILDEEFIGPLREETAGLVNAFNSGAQTYDDHRELRRDILFTRGIAVTADGQVAISNELSTNLRSAFNDGGVGSHPINVYEDNSSRFSLKNAFSNFVRDRIAPIFAPALPQPALVPVPAYIPQ